MNKPITVARDEFRRALASLVSNSTLPAFVVYDTLLDMARDVSKIADAQLEHDTRAWEAAQAAEAQQGNTGDAKGGER